ncbi:MAG: hypothetical protein EAZ07_03095 [Cytophagales bacterium]|nr:MAG: hypothetical protein EAZ07_03095 [Cytophagales bacterium]
MRALRPIFVFSTLLLLFIGCSKLSQKSTSTLPNIQLNQIAEANFSEGMKYYATENFSDAKSWFLKTLSVNKDIAAAHYMLGKIFYLEKKINESTQHSLEATRLEPKNRHYYHQLAQLYERQNNFKEAIATYKKLINEVPNSDEFLYEIGTNYIYLQNFDEATKTYSKIEQIFGGSIELTRQKQQLYLKMNKLDLAIDEGNKYIKEHPEDIDMKITQAEILYTNNKGEEAILYLEKVILQHPTNGDAQLLLMNIYKAKGDITNYEKQLNYVFSNTDVSAENKLMVLQEMATDPNDETRKKAIKYAELASKLHPQDAKLYEAHGDLFLADKKTKEGREKYYKAISIQEKDFNLWIKLIQSDAMLNETDSMIIHSEKAISYFPNQSLFWMYGGIAYQIKKQCSKAIDWLEEARKLAEKNSTSLVEIHSRLGDCYNDVKEHEKSNQSYEEALKIDKNNDYVLNNYSYYLSLRKENLDKAREMSNKLIKRNPYEANYLDTHAWVLYMLKDYEGALKILEVAVANSSNGTIVEHYGDVLYQLGRKEEAIIQWKKAKELGDTSPLIDKKIADQKLYEE